MKEKPYVKVAMYALNIIFAIIIIVPVIYCFNVSMMDLKEIYGGKFWPSHLTIENYTRASVSYTHLDVYKRQQQGFFQGICKALRDPAGKSGASES